VFSGLSEFREHMGGELNIPLLAGIGVTCEARQMDLAQVEAAISFLCARDAAR
jgi:3-dehydroquinate synthase